MTGIAGCRKLLVLGGSGGRRKFHSDWSDGFTRFFGSHVNQDREALQNYFHALPLEARR